MTTPSSDFPVSGDAAMSEATARSDSLGVDDQDLDADTTGEDDTSDTTIGETPGDPGGSGGTDVMGGSGEWTGDEGDVANQDVLSVDPDEYSDEPHIGSVPRVLGEDEYMPDTQGEDPIYAELGEEGQGDLAPEDE